MKLPRRAWTDERGAELIEFAFALPILLLVVAGIVDFGILFQRYETVTNAAREGARIGILPDYSEADIQGRVNTYLAASGLTARRSRSGPIRRSRATITASRSTPTRHG